MKGRNIKEAELNKMQRMIDAGMADEDIAYCMDCSEKTVERIRKGEHVLQIREKLAKAETITHNPEQKNEDVFIGAILANQAEYIDRKLVLDELCRDNCERIYDGTCHNCRMTDTIADFPAADVAPVMHGKWILEREPDGTPYCFHCSVCDDDFHYIGIMAATDYCPNCGAKMDKEECGEGVEGRVGMV